MTGIPWQKPGLAQITSAADSEGGNDYTFVTEFGVFTQSYTTSNGNMYDPGNGSLFSGSAS